MEMEISERKVNLKLSFTIFSLVAIGSVNRASRSKIPSSCI